MAPLLKRRETLTGVHKIIRNAISFTSKRSNGSVRLEDSSQSFNPSKQFVPDIPAKLATTASAVSVKRAGSYQIPLQSIAVQKDVNWNVEQAATHGSVYPARGVS